MWGKTFCLVTRSVKAKCPVSVVKETHRKERQGQTEVSFSVMSGFATDETWPLPWRDSQSPTGHPGWRADTYSDTGARGAERDDLKSSRPRRASPGGRRGAVLKCEQASLVKTRR